MIELILVLWTTTKEISLPLFSSWQRITAYYKSTSLMLVKMYTCKSIQNEIIHIYGSKIKSNVTNQLREQRLPFTIIADECTDSYSNQEVLSVCLRFVDLSSFKDPHIKECFIGFIHLDRTNASTISKKILECISVVFLTHKDPK